jgi:hypothetical protein
MRVLVAGVNEEFLVHFTAQAVLRQHAFDSPFDDGVRAAAEEVLGDLFLLSAGVTGEIDVDLVFQFVTGKHNLIGVDHYDEVAAIDVRSVIGFVLAPENGGNFGTHATDGLISTVHDIPVAFNGSLVRVFGGEMQFAHFLFFLREAVAIPMAVKWMNFFGWVWSLPSPRRKERKIRPFGREVPRKMGVIFIGRS